MPNVFDVLGDLARDHPWGLVVVALALIAYLLVMNPGPRAD
jgi:hypothetical protein